MATSSIFNQEEIFQPFPICQECPIASVDTNHAKVWAQEAVEFALAQTEEVYDGYLNGDEGQAELEGDFKLEHGFYLIESESRAVLDCAQAHKCGECTVRFSEEE